MQRHEGFAFATSEHFLYVFQENWHDNYCIEQFGMKFENYSIDDTIIGTHFACDLLRCKGACCTFPGGSGAPLLEEEIPILERAYPIVKHLLPREHVAVIEAEGVAGGRPGDRWVRCLNDEACVFVMYDGDIAKCAIQHAYYQGQFDWEKPQSCHLFPIRVSGAARNILRMESFSECEPAFERGDAENIKLVDFVHGALQRSFGPALVSALRREAQTVE